MKLEPLLPIPKGRKGTCLKDWSTLPWGELAKEVRANNGGNVGLRMDLFFALDPDCPEAEKFCNELDADGELPSTVTWRTASGYTVRLYNPPPGRNHKAIHLEKTKGAPFDLEVRTGSGQYCVIPPSYLPASATKSGSAGKYEWIPGHSPDEIDPADFPIELYERLQEMERTPAPGKKGPQENRNPGEKIGLGARNNLLTSLAGSMRRRGMGEEAILAALQVENQKKLEPPLSDKEVAAIAKSISKYEPGWAAPAACLPTNSQAGRYFPETPFPWDAIPPYFHQSFKQLGEACSSAPEPLFGYAASILSSCLGASLTVSPKPSWREPLIIWFAELADSGQGKTHKARLLANQLEKAQEYEYERFKEEQKEYESNLEDWAGLQKSIQKNTPKPQPPEKPRPYLAHNFTFEALARDLSDHPTGGLVVHLDELSAVITGQNAYRQGRGTDRESLLALFDGHPVRIVRVKGDIFIPASRVCFCGGIQPATLQKIFGEGSGGLFQSDGTLYRFLIHPVRRAVHPLTRTSWDDDNQKVWDRLITAAFAFGGQHAKEPKTLILAEAEWEIFRQWRDDLYHSGVDIPPSLYGFIPKLTGYALRLAGVVHFCLHHSDEVFPMVLDSKALTAGMELASFYLAQAETALRVVNQGDLPEAAKNLFVEGIRKLLGENDHLEISVKDFLTAINKAVPEGEVQASWPKKERGVKPALLRSLLALDRVGIKFTFSQRKNTGYFIIFCKNNIHNVHYIHKVNNIIKIGGEH